MEAYTGIGLGLVLIIFFGTNRRRTASVRVIGIAVGLLVTSATCYVFSPGTFLAESEPLGTPYRELALYACMLLGMCARFLNIAIEKRKTHPEKKFEIDLFELAQPFLVSGITFGSVLAATSKTEVTIETVIIAFETGFCWQTVLQKATG